MIGPLFYLYLLSPLALVAAGDRLRPLANRLVMPPSPRVTCGSRLFYLAQRGHRCPWMVRDWYHEMDRTRRRKGIKVKLVLHI